MKFKIVMTNGSLVTEADHWTAAVQKGESLASTTGGELRVVQIHDDKEKDAYDRPEGSRPFGRRGGI